ncbi:unnamed protein product [Malus baccata var. baccata]
MNSEDAVFPLLEGVDLASCMGVCKQWRRIARDDFFWKCLCAKRWPSTCKRPNPPTSTYYKLLSFDDWEFFIDIWDEDRFLFSEVVPGRVLDRDIKIQPPGVRDMLRFHLKGPEYKMKLAVEEGIWAWISLLFMDNGDEGVVDVFGIEMDFMDAANSMEEVLKLLDMLDWK